MWPAAALRAAPERTLESAQSASRAATEHRQPLGASLRGCRLTRKPCLNDLRSTQWRVPTGGAIVLALSVMFFVTLAVGGIRFHLAR